MDKKSEKIIALLGEKSVTKQIVYHNTLNAFKELKEALKFISEQLKKNIKDFEQEVKIDFKDKGLFEAELHVGGDVLIFSMHTNVFKFTKDHSIYNLEYIKKDSNKAFCGVIHIYNFLGDSLKYNRQLDPGYLVGRVFLNKEYHFFVEGKHQLGFNFNHFDKQSIDKEKWTEIIQSAIIYALEFDLVSPPYNSVQEISVLEKIQQAGLTAIKTAKKMGFRFNVENGGT